MLVFFFNRDPFTLVINDQVLDKQPVMSMKMPLLRIMPNTIEAETTENKVNVADKVDD